MQSIIGLLTFDGQNEHDPEHKVLFSEPKIYDADGDLSKRWYVYFSFRDPENGKLKYVTPFYGYANKYITKEARLSVLVTYRNVLL